MASVNITTSKNTVTVQEGDATTVTVATQGPIGPKGLDLDETAKVDGSVVYYSSSASKFKADNVQTLLTLVDGGNF